MAKKKQTFTPEQKEQRRIYAAEWRLKNKARKISANIEWMANRSPAKVAEDKARNKINKAKWSKENPNTILKHTKATKLKNDLGYFAVYIIEDYMGKGDHYCGQTGNLYNRMKAHRKLGRLNTEAYRILQCFETREQAMAFEAIQHEAGYHGYNNGH